MQAVLGAAAQNVLARESPFGAAEEVGLALIQQAAEMLAEVGQAMGSFQEIADAGSIEVGVVLGEVRR